MLMLRNAADRMSRRSRGLVFVRSKADVVFITHSFYQTALMLGRVFLLRAPARRIPACPRVEASRTPQLYNEYCRVSSAMLRQAMAGWQWSCISTKTLRALASIVGDWICPFCVASLSIWAVPIPTPRYHLSIGADADKTIVVCRKSPVRAWWYLRPNYEL